MSKLRRAEEKRLMPRRLGAEERRQMVERLGKALEKRREILLALIHGGFASSSVFRDIDVAVYTGYRISYEEEPLYTLELSEELTRITGIPVDVHLLDYAPPGFQAETLRNGITLVERMPGLRSKLLIRALEDREKLLTFSPH